MYQEIDTDAGFILNLTKGTLAMTDLSSWFCRRIP